MAFVVVGNQKGFATDLGVCGAYYGYYPQNCSVPNVPRSALKVVVVGEVAAGCMTWVHSGRAADADRVGQHPCCDVRRVQERREAIPVMAIHVMENSAGREASLLDGALKLPAAHVPSFPPLPVRGERSS